MYRIFLVLFIGACYLSTVDNKNSKSKQKSIESVSTNMLFEAGNHIQSTYFYDSITD